MWFAPLPHLTTKIVTALPERFRHPERNEWSDINRAGHAVDAAFEGPCFDAQGRLYIVDIPYGRIFRVDGSEWELVTQYDGLPNGMKVLPDGKLILLSQKVAFYARPDSDKRRDSSISGWRLIWISERWMTVNGGFRLMSRGL